MIGSVILILIGLGLFYPAYRDRHLHGDGDMGKGMIDLILFVIGILLILIGILRW